jgi:hypothetical protein
MLRFIFKAACLQISQNISRPPDESKYFKKIKLENNVLRFYEK